MQSEPCIADPMISPTCSLKYGMLHMPGLSQMPSSDMNSPATILRAIAISFRPFALYNVALYDGRSDSKSSPGGCQPPGGPPAGTLGARLPENLRLRRV